MELSGRTILITGGTSGIGKALAQELKKQNLVMVTGTNPQRLDEAAQSGLIAVRCDLAQIHEIEELVTFIERDIQSLDVLINNAGVQNNYDFANTTAPLKKVEQEITINLTGAIQLTQLLLPTLLTKPSHIINVTSALGAVPKSDGLVYSASKAGLRNFTQGLRKVLAKEAISIHELVPPVTDTAMTAGREEKKMPPEQLVQIALRQLGTGKLLLAPAKIRFFLWLSRVMPGVANRIIG